MKLQRTTLILILIALGSGGFVYFYEIKGATSARVSQGEKAADFFF